MKYVWVLGAADPEMEVIERMLRANAQEIVYAQIGGERVRPADAYAAENVGMLVTGARVVLVECDGPGLRLGDPIRCDHHRPGDPGFGRPPAEYWQASSLGQVCVLLSVAPTSELRLVAAADHCLSAAYRGQCPGISSDALMRWRAASRAAFQRRSVAAVLVDISVAMTEIKAAPRMLIPVGDVDGAGRCTACDALRSSIPADGCCTGHLPVELVDMRRPDPVPELPEAAARLGVGYVSGPLRDARGGPDKYTCSGTYEQVWAWMEWAPSQGLTGIYGDPARGFAGGYLP